MTWNILDGDANCGPFNKPLKVNQACLKIISELDFSLKFFTRNIQCYKCNFMVQGRIIAPKNTTSYVIDTKYGLESYFKSGSNIFCKMTNYFEDFGIYTLNVSENSCSHINMVKMPERLWLNIIFVVLFYMGGVALYWLAKFLYKYGHFGISTSSVSLRELEMDLGNPNDRLERSQRLQRQSRISSIDAFRGLAILLMIFVNYNGGDYSVFKHTPWNGLRIADLIFPWFVWIMGASIVLSLRSSLRTSRTKANIFFRILKRSVLLIILGIILNSGHRESNYLRVCGVLQRLGLTYFIVASIEILIAKPQRNEQLNGLWYYCQDIIESWVQWSIAIFFTVAHVLLTFALKVPGCPTGYLGPGGLSEHSMYKNCTGGAAGYIDHLVITDRHMYHHGSFVSIFKPSVPYDPEGLLGSLTCILCAFFGVQGAQIILNFENPYIRIRKWLIWAGITAVSAGILCNWSENDGIIPVNKNLWSLSYVLACSSSAFVILAIFYWLIDYTHFWTGFPFLYPGMNSITLYLGHSLLKTQLPWHWTAFTNTHLELLFMDVSATAIWLLISYLLYRSHVFLTL